MPTQPRWYRAYCWNRLLWGRVQLTCDGRARAGGGTTHRIAGLVVWTIRAVLTPYLRVTWPVHCRKDQIFIFSAGVEGCIRGRRAGGTDEDVEDACQRWQTSVSRQIIPRRVDGPSPRPYRFPDLLDIVMIASINLENRSMSAWSALAVREYGFRTQSVSCGSRQLPRRAGLNLGHRARIHLARICPARLVVQLTGQAPATSSVAVSAPHTPRPPRFCLAPPPQSSSQGLTGTRETRSGP